MLCVCVQYDSSIARWVAYVICMWLLRKYYGSWYDVTLAIVVVVLMIFPCQLFETHSVHKQYFCFVELKRRGTPIRTDFCTNHAYFLTVVLKQLFCM